MTQMVLHDPRRVLYEPKGSTRTTVLRKLKGSKTTKYKMTHRLRLQTQSSTQQISSSLSLLPPRSVFSLHSSNLLLLVVLYLSIFFTASLFLSVSLMKTS